MRIMTTKRTISAQRIGLALLFLSLWTVSPGTVAEERLTMTNATLTEESVIQFLHHLEELGAQKNFDVVEAMIHDDAFFRFTDGDFIGKPAVRTAFEKTWQGSAKVQNERFFLTEIQVLSVDASSATATYTWNWEGSVEGHAFQIKGRGTRVLVLTDGRLQIIHEHLSRFPK